MIMSLKTRCLNFTSSMTVAGFIHHSSRKQNKTFGLLYQLPLNMRKPSSTYANIDVNKQFESAAAVGRSRSCAPASIQENLTCDVKRADV